MQNLAITLTPGTLPRGYCFTDFQTLLNDFVARISASVPGNYSLFNYGSSEPSPEDRNKPWYRLLPSGAPDKWYVFYAGYWVSPHSVAPLSQERRIFTGLEADVWAYDGGDGADPSTTAPSAATGAMWQVDHDFDFRFLLGAGTSPASNVTLGDGTVKAIGGTTVAPGDVGGEELHKITPDELAQHQHFIANDKQFQAAGQNPFSNLGSANTLNRALTTSPAQAYELMASNDVAIVGLSSKSGNDSPHNNMPPFKGVFFIKRTARSFYRPV